MKLTLSHRQIEIYIEIKKDEKYPLLVWLEENAFTATDITDHIKIISLDLEKEYEININPKGVVQKLHCIDCVCKV